MQIIWTEDDIREQMRFLDKKTRLSGAELPIQFINERTTLGMFSTEDGGVFSFSNNWFQDPSWPRTAAIDTIRHEYAHYMAWERFGGRCGHGDLWKQCCREIGARPRRLYDASTGEIFKSIQMRKNQRVDYLRERFHTGDSVLHPHYGSGTIQDIDAWLCATILFNEVGEKRLSLDWIDKNC